MADKSTNVATNCFLSLSSFASHLISSFSFSFLSLILSLSLSHIRLVVTWVIYKTWHPPSPLPASYIVSCACSGRVWLILARSAVVMAPFLQQIIMDGCNDFLPIILAASRIFYNLPEASYKRKIHYRTLCAKNDDVICHN